MLSLVLGAIGVAVTVLLAGLAALARSLTPAAAAVAAAFGAVIVLLVGFAFLALLVLFVFASVLATRYGFEEKRRRHVQEGTHGERGVPNVLAHVIVPTALVLVAFARPEWISPPALVLLYTASLAFGAADTFASEFGVLSGAARSILTLRPVRPGTNGGVSGAGELWAFLGALTTSMVALVLFSLLTPGAPSAGLLLWVPTVAGFLGCQVDSVLGEALENRGWLTKSSTNLLAMGSTVGIAVVGVYLAGGPW